MKDSLKYFLKKYPFFLNKKEDSNFTKTKKVFNNRLRDVSNDIFQVYLAGMLEKHVLIWRVQEQAYDFDIHFHVSLDYIKSVEIIRFKGEIEEVIYSETFTYEDSINKVEYLYEGHSETIIPPDKFMIYVTTYEEYTITKGFPENDTYQGNDYDHDTSLDSFGTFYDIPRKTYKKLDTTNLSDEQIISYYAKTEYPFNDRLTEDDYHYMTRIFKYISHLNKIPLPVLEIWKLYGLDPENEKEITFINRERYLARMFEESRHVRSNGEYNPSWKPERWEHKDPIYCPVEPDIFFFANVNNASPVQGMTITFDFDFLNEYARRVDKDYYIIPYLIKELDGELVYVRYCEDKCINTKTHGYLWDVPTDTIPGIETEAQFDFVFRAYENYDDYKVENDNYLESDVIRIIIKGCNSADIYVDCVTGSDKNDGTSWETAYRSLEYALTQMHGAENVIALRNKNQQYYMDNSRVIDETCSIISCPSGAVIYQNNGWEFFRVMQDTTLYLQGIHLKHKCCTMISKSTEFINRNVLNYPLSIQIPKWLCKIATKINMARDMTVHAHRNIQLTGLLLTDVGDYEVGAEYVDGITQNCPVTTTTPNEPVADEEMDLYLDNNLLGSDTTDETGAYSFQHTFETLGLFILQVKHDESTKYCNIEDAYHITVEAMPTVLNITAPARRQYIEESFTVPYNVKDKYGPPITGGTLKLYEDGVLVKTINNGQTLTYTPAVADMHSYRLVWSKDETYVDSSATFDVEVVKYNTTLFLIGEGKSVYSIDEDVHFTGLLTDELDRPVKNMPVKVFCDNNLLTTLTTDNNGEVAYSGRLPAGKHTLQLQFLTTPKYMDSISNTYRVRVRETPLSDIRLYLYPEHKILGQDTDSIPLHVYACNNQGEPLSTSFKLWDTYSSACESNTSPTYTTRADGWWSGSLTTDAIHNCQGLYVQAVSTLDEDVYSKTVHIMISAEPELEVFPSIFTDKSVYSYKNEAIHVSGELIDEDEDPVPNENVIVKVYADNTVVETFNLRTTVKGEYKATYTTTAAVRGKDLTFKLTYSKHAGAYAACSDEVTVAFKQLATTINAENISCSTGEKVHLTGTVIDENNIPADEGSVKITFNGDENTVELVDGVFNLVVDALLTPNTYPENIAYIENTYYKSSDKTVNVTITKITPVLSLVKEHTLVRYETYVIPYTLTLPSIRDPISTPVPITGTLKLQKTDGIDIVTVDVNEELEVIFDTKQQITAKLVYNGNNYIGS